MTKHRSSTVAAASAKKPQSGASLHALLLAVLAALCVARPLLPSEGVAWLGDGQPFNMIALSLAVLTCLAAVGHGGLNARWTPTDAAVLLLGLCYAAGALHAVVFASPRPAFNLLWEWSALGFVYFLVRQLVQTAAERRAIVAVMIALAVVLASYGYYQYFVSMPADRQEYARDPDAMLRRNDFRYAPGSIERQQFENRLRSTEPLATFALTNSLAGYLAPWLLVTVGIGAGVWVAKKSAESPTEQSHGDRAVHPRSSPRLLLTLAAAVIVIGGCLILTKSRSAYVASALGLLLLPFSLPAVRARLHWRLALGILALIGLLVGAAVAVRGLDRAVLSQAGKSLGYRLEYWQSTWAMVCDHPWFGCGPGNFQDAYMRYKLPQASEEIQDPHNLFFEVWATAGTPAMLALVGVLGLFGWQTWRRAEPESGSTAGGPLTKATTIGLTVGAAAGFLLANVVGPLVDMDFIGTMAWAGVGVGAVALIGLWPWVRGGALAPALIPLAVLILVVHLLAAGGIGFPGVAYSFWILLALGVNQTRGARIAADAAPSAVAHAGSASSTRNRVPWGSIAMMSLAGALATACYLTAYGPVLRLTAAMYRVQSEEQRLHLSRRELALVEASQADPLSSKTWQMLADLDFQRLGRRGSGEAERMQFDIAVRTMLRLRPQSSGACRQAGEWYLELFRLSGDPADGQKSLEFYERAVELYPNSALMHAEFALALATLGKRAEARQESRCARDLDTAMPHADKKLPTDLLNHLPADETTGTSP